MRILGLAVALAVLALAVAPEDAGAGSSGSVSGVLFHDLNGDGLPQPDEPGFAGLGVWIRQPGEYSEVVHTRTDGSYAVLDVPPGDYEVWALGFGPEQFGCPDAVVPSFDPLHTQCPPGAELPWNPTGPTEVEVTLDPAGAVEANFGADPMDAAIVRGLAILETRRVDAGTVVQAFVHGQECGSTESQDAWYILDVLGEAERPGCAQPGDEITFEVGGVPAGQTFTWKAPFYQSLPRVRSLSLVAIEEHAWYWFESKSTGPELGSVVEAVIGDTKCGEATVEGEPTVGEISGLIGFEQLLVPSAQLQPGCGTPGATVSFAVDGEDSGVTAGWAPGIEEIGLSRFGPPPAELPPTGDAPGRAPSLAPVAASVPLLAVALASLLLAWRRRGAS